MVKNALINKKHIIVHLCIHHGLTYVEIASDTVTVGDRVRIIYLQPNSNEPRR